MALTAAMMLGTAFAGGFSKPMVRLIFWIGFALLTAWSMTISVAAVLAVVAVLVAVNLPRKGGREVLNSCVEAMADGARQALPVGLACALVGIVTDVPVARSCRVNRDLALKTKLLNARLKHRLADRRAADVAQTDNGDAEGVHQFGGTGAREHPATLCP